jgi:hypothetical protein
MQRVGVELTLNWNVEEPDTDVGSKIKGYDQITWVNFVSLLQCKHTSTYCQESGWLLDASVLFVGQSNGTRTLQAASSPAAKAMSYRCVAVISAQVFWKVIGTARTIETRQAKRMI